MKKLLLRLLLVCCFLVITLPASANLGSDLKPARKAPVLMVGACSDLVTPSPFRRGCIMDRRTFLAGATAATGILSGSPALAADGGKPVRETPLRAGYFGTQYYDD